MQEEELYNIAFPMCICRLRLAWISSENSTTHEKCWLILTGLPSLRLDPISCQLVSLLSGVDWTPASPFTNCLPPSPFVQLLLVFSCLLRSRRDLESKLFIWFCAQTDKGIVFLVDHLHSVTVVQKDIGLTKVNKHFCCRYTLPPLIKYDKLNQTAIV